MPPAARHRHTRWRELRAKQAGQPHPVRRFSMRLNHRRSWAVGAVALAVAGAGLAVVNSAQAATGCQVAYTVASQWQGGFGANVSITNLGSPISSWQLTWSFTAGQTITQLWNGSFTQSGAN